MIHSNLLKQVRRQCLAAMSAYNSTHKDKISLQDLIIQQHQKQVRLVVKAMKGDSLLDYATAPNYESIFGPMFSYFLAEEDLDLVSGPIILYPPHSID